MNTREQAKKYYKWANEDQLDCLVMHSDIMGGFHHSCGEIRPCGDSGIVINEQWAPYFATFDYNSLTKAVVLAHDRMIRFQISPSGPRMLKFTYHKRNTREGDIAKRHPTIEDAIIDVRKYFPEQE